MYNCLVLGAGRSGTSMVAGTLSKKYHRGKNLLPPRDANPKGFFESSFIIREINEPLLASAIPNLIIGQRWLSVLPIKSKIPKIAIVRERIKHVVSKTPFCYKDPRFCYTLPAWRPFLKNTRFICVFRHPLTTAQSVITSCKTDKYLKTMKMDITKSFLIWSTMYTHVLKKHRHTGDWLFVHYDQMFEIQTLTKIEQFLDAKVDKTFPERKLRKAVQKDIRKIKLPKNVSLLYKNLCTLASFGKK